MSYRILKISVPYQSAVRSLYARHPDLAMRSYAAQAQAVRDSCILMLDFVGHFTDLGVEAEEVYFRVEPMRQAYIRENGLKLDCDEIAVLADQVRRFNPHVLYVDDSYILQDRVLEVIRAAPALRLSLGRSGHVITDAIESQIRHYDCLVAISEPFQQMLKEKGFRSFVMQQGFETRVLDKLPSVSVFSPCDLLFCGSFYAMHGAHNHRMQVISELADIPCDFVIRSATLTPRPIPPEGPSLKDRFIERVKHLVKPEVSGIEMLDALRQARIGFNTHLDAIVPLANNMRLYEVTGIGTCLLTDYKVNMADSFEPDYELVTYSTPQEARSKVLWLLEHPKERAKIAEAGQKRTMRQHTTRHRFEGMHQELLKILG